LFDQDESVILVEWKVGLHTYLPFIYFLKNVNRTVIDQPVRFFFTINVMLSGLRITSPPQLNSKAFAKVGVADPRRYSGWSPKCAASLLNAADHNHAPLLVHKRARALFKLKRKSPDLSIRASNHSYG